MFYGYILAASVTQSGWVTLAKVPVQYKNAVVFIFSPLVGESGDNTLYRRDGDINGESIRAYLATEDNGKRVNFEGIMVL